MDSESGLCEEEALCRLEDCVAGGDALAEEEAFLELGAREAEPETGDCLRCEGERLRWRPL